MIKPFLIVMLTNNDKTVENALQLFNELSDLPVKNWGFKDIGLPKEQMKDLVSCMKKMRKTTYLEVVTLSEHDGMAGAKLAVEAGFDVLMGTVYFDSIRDFLKDKATKYYPFSGKVSGHPSVLGGSIEEIVAHSHELESKAVQGLDLLTYRYSGDARRLLEEVVKAVHIPIVSAGSIESIERIVEVRDAGAVGFTIGTAFFEKKFVPQGTLRENILKVHHWLESNANLELMEDQRPLSS